MNLSNQSQSSSRLMNRAIVVTLFCFPTGLFAIRALHRMEVAMQSGAVEEAKHEEELAQAWIRRSIILGIVFLLLFIILLIIAIPYLMDFVELLIDGEGY